LTPVRSDNTPGTGRNTTGKKQMNVLSSEMINTDDVFQNRDSEASSQTDMYAADGEL